MLLVESLKFKASSTFVVCNRAAWKCLLTSHSLLHWGGVRRM